MRHFTAISGATIMTFRPIGNGQMKVTSGPYDLGTHSAKIDEWIIPAIPFKIIQYHDKTEEEAA